jgi:hypothetical protein
MSFLIRIRSVATVRDAPNRLAICTRMCVLISRSFEVDKQSGCRFADGRYAESVIISLVDTDSHWRQRSLAMHMPLTSSLRRASRI